MHEYVDFLFTVQCNYAVEFGIFIIICALTTHTHITHLTPIAPEVISNHRYSFMPDWWGLGCVVYEMIHGECPFRRRKEKVSREEVERRVRDDTISFPDKFTPEAKLFVSQV